MKRFLILLIALVCLVGATPAHAENLSQGDVFPLKAQLVTTATIDPLLGWGQAPFGHTHGFLGNGAIMKGSSVTLNDLLASPASENKMNLASWKSLIWAPVIQKDGIDYPPMKFNTYYFKPAGEPRMNSPPNGLRTVFGNPQNTTSTSGLAKWLCPGDPQSTSRRTIPTSCAQPGSIAALSQVGGCWDGKDLGPGLGGTATGNGRDNIEPCSEHPDWQRIPTLLNTFYYPEAAIGGRLSSDHPVAAAGTSFHFDYVFAWDLDSTDRPALPEIVGECFNQDILTPVGALQCEVVPKNDGSGKDYVRRVDTKVKITD